MSANGNGRGRANGEGSFYANSNRNGYAAYVWVTTPTGRKTRKYIYGQDREKLHDEWVQLKAKAAKMPIPTSTPTVAEYITYWLAEVIKPNREDNTHSHYELMSRLHIIPGIGKKRIDKLTVRETQAWLNKMPGNCQCCAPGKDARRKQAQVLRHRRVLRGLPEPPRDRGGARNTLRAALNNAMREELISRNVAELVTLPKARKKNRRKNSWTVAEARKFLECSRNENDPLYPLWVLIIVLGMRKGEALGQIWPEDETWPPSRKARRRHRPRMAATARRRAPAHSQAGTQGRRQHGNSAATAHCRYAALRIAKRESRCRSAPTIGQRRAFAGKRTQLVFTTRNGQPDRAAEHQASFRSPVQNGTASARSRFTTRAGRAAHCWPRSTCTRASPWHPSAQPDRAHDGDLHPGTRQDDQGRAQAAERLARPRRRPGVTPRRPLVRTS